MTFLHEKKIVDCPIIKKFHSLNNSPVPNLIHKKFAREIKPKRGNNSVGLSSTLSTTIP